MVNIHLEGIFIFVHIQYYTALPRYTSICGYFPFLRLNWVFSPFRFQYLIRARGESDLLSQFPSNLAPWLGSIEQSNRFCHWEIYFYIRHQRCFTIPEGICTDEFLSRKPGFLISAMHSHTFRWFSDAPLVFLFLGFLPLQLNEIWRIFCFVWKRRWVDFICLFVCRWLQLAQLAKGKSLGRSKPATSS